MAIMRRLWAVLARSVRNPLIIGVGTGAVLIIGTAPVVLAATGTASPSPSDSTSAPASPSPKPDPSTTTKPPTPPPPADPWLSLGFTRYPTSIQQGSTATMYIQVVPHIAKDGKSAKNVALQAGSSRAKVTFIGAHGFSTLSYSKFVEISVSVPSSVSSGNVVIWAHVQADNADSRYAKSLSLAVKKKPKSHSTTPTSGGGGGAPTTPSGSDLNPGTPSATSTPPQTAASLPDLTQQQTPTTAPVQNSSNSQSMRSTGDDADQLTFDKLASTQAAWLAALLVAFSLLLTQVRLGRTTGKTPKPKGTHRKTRRSPGRAH